MYPIPLLETSVSVLILENHFLIPYRNPPLECSMNGRRHIDTKWFFLSQFHEHSSEEMEHIIDLMVLGACLARNN